MKRAIYLMAGLLGLAAGAFGTHLTVRALTSGPQVVHAQWASSAATVPELMAEADLVVLVEAGRPDAPRKFAVPIDPAAQKPGLSVDVTPFTHTRMRVQQIYKGSAGSAITVVQTGGALERTSDHPAVNLVFSDDPLFTEGGTHVLFLKDISRFEGQATGEQLYMIVNPAGRYDLHGQSVVTHSEDNRVARPTMLAELMRQIDDASRQ